MNRCSKLLIVIITLSFLVGGCNSENKNEVSQIEGTLKIVVAFADILQQSDSIAIQVADNNGKVIYAYEKQSDIPTSELRLNPGEYIITGTPTNKKTPSFGGTLYAGSTAVKITAGTTTEGKLILKQKGFKMSIGYSDKFKSEYTNYTTTVTCPSGSLTYSSKETRMGIFLAGPVEIKLTYTDNVGANQTIFKNIDAENTDISAGSSLSLIFKHPDEESGGNYDGYYQNASGKTGIDLKKALTTIISNGYLAKSYNDLWSAYKIGDIRTDGTGAIWDVYSDIPSGKAAYLYQPGQDQCGSYTGEGNCYNREHTIPKSWFNDDSPMYSDYLHILPTDGYVNGKRSNFPYGEVGTAT